MGPMVLEGASAVWVQIVLAGKLLATIVACSYLLHSLPVVLQQLRLVAAPEDRRTRVVRKEPERRRLCLAAGPGGGSHIL